MTFSAKSEMRELVRTVRSAHNKLMLLDYDGTLVKHESVPSLARPTKKLLNILKQLTENSTIDVVVISGRKYNEIEDFLGHLPISLIAEHGAMVKKGAKWLKTAEPDIEWKYEIMPLVQGVTNNCPLSFIEEKTFSIAWHYRNAEEKNANEKIAYLIAELKKHKTSEKLRLIHGNKVLEIANKNFDKGQAISELLRDKSYDCIICIGDDQTDEDMFRYLKSNSAAITIKVGAGETAAKFTLASQQQAMKFLKEIIK